MHKVLQEAHIHADKAEKLASEHTLDKNPTMWEQARAAYQQSLVLLNSLCFCPLEDGEYAWELDLRLGQMQRRYGFYSFLVSNEDMTDV